MKLFVWNYVENATSSYHNGGGLVVIAETLERAREIIKPQTGNDGDDCAAITKDPDIIRECDGPEYIAIHPDAGCC